jgi:hypothetical protein
MNDNYKTIYEQRYETYRHLDKLRWFIFQIAISVIAGILVLKNPEQEYNIFAIGLVLFSSGILMAKINYCIDKNNTILQSVGAKIGDDSIPTPKKDDKYKSVSWLISYSLISIGTAILFYELLQFVCTLFTN